MNRSHQRELTFRAVVLGILLSMALAAANAYLGLFAGMTVSASIPAAVVSMGLLRLLRHGGVLENNLVQTAASAGESLAAGVVFTFPALVLLDFWTDFDYLWVTAIAGFGGVLGVLFTIPLRRSLIVEADLAFPEGVATAEVLETGERGGSEIKYLVQASLLGALFKFGAGGLQIWHEVFAVAGRVGRSVAYVGTNLSPALLSVGYIVGLNIAVLVFLGGAFNWLVAIPTYAVLNDWPLSEGGEALSALEGAEHIWSQTTRYIGVGAMLIGGLWTVFQVRGSLLGGFTAGLKAYRGLNDYATREPSDDSAPNGTDRRPGRPPRTERDIPMKWVMVMIVGSIVPLFLIYEHFIGAWNVSIPMALVMLGAGFLFSAVAGYMAGLVGSSNNPISGITITTVLCSSLLLLVLMGAEAGNGPAAAIIVGSVVCCAAAIAGDNMQDLKAGRIVGATPWKQQVMQLVGTVSAALVMGKVLTLLYEAYGFEGHASGEGNPGALAAPQANLMAMVARGVFEKNIPWGFMGVGMALAVVIIAWDGWLRRRGSDFRAPVLAVAIGIYLPFELSAPIFMGGLLRWATEKWYRHRQLRGSVVEVLRRHGLLFASGLITGEAIVGILLAIPIVITENARALAVTEEPLGAWPGMILLAGVAYWFYRVSTADLPTNEGGNDEAA